MNTVNTATEIRLEPRLVKGELIGDSWWEPPAQKRLSFLRRHWLVLVTVVLPLAFAGIYYGLIAADQYRSETQFIVRSSSGSEFGNLASLMSGQKLTRATDETYAVGQYMLSRDAMMDMVRDYHLREIFGRSEADIFNRYPNFFSRNKDEEMYRHYEHYVDIENDPESGISTLRVFAFTSEDAQAFAKGLVEKSEELVNRLNRRAYEDTLRYATQVVEEQKARLVEAEQSLTQFRNDAKIIDPSKELTASYTALGSLTADLMQAEADYAQKSAITEKSPALTTLRQRILAIEGEITKQRGQLAGDGASMASKLATYESLMLTREFAAKELEVALIHMTSAQEDAKQQRLYLETIVQPNAPDYARYPRRLLNMLLIAVGCFCVFWISRAAIRTMLEHQI